MNGSPAPPVPADSPARRGRRRARPRTVSIISSISTGLPGTCVYSDIVPAPSRSAIARMDRAPIPSASAKFDGGVDDRPHGQTRPARPVLRPPEQREASRRVGPGGFSRRLSRGHRNILRPCLVQPDRTLYGTSYGTASRGRPCNGRPMTRRRDPGPAIEVRGLRKHYPGSPDGTGTERHRPAGRAGHGARRCSARTGPGKTTAVRILTTLLRTDAGTAPVAGYRRPDPGPCGAPPDRAGRPGRGRRRGAHRAAEPGD